VIWVIGASGIDANEAGAMDRAYGLRIVGIAGIEVLSMDTGRGWWACVGVLDPEGGLERVRAEYYEGG
jgi:hypothetical protein